MCVCACIPWSQRDRWSCLGRAGEPHFIETVPHEATSEMGYPPWPAKHTCVDDTIHFLLVPACQQNNFSSKNASCESRELTSRLLGLRHFRMLRPPYMFYSGPLHLQYTSPGLWGDQFPYALFRVRVRVCDTCILHVCFFFFFLACGLLKETAP